jgi:hypothetical protein
MNTPTRRNQAMNDDPDPRGRLCRSSLTPELLDDYVLTGIMEDEADVQRGRHERLALRQRLDRAMRDRLGWPREQDYGLIADDLERLGWLTHAATLRDLTGTDQLIGQAAEQWTRRYWCRGETVPELEMDRKLAMDSTSLADADPVPGIDGATYQRGYVDTEGGGHFVIVRGRGLAELIEFGDDEQTCDQWVASRGALATGPLHPPAALQNSRTWQEEQLLAAMLCDPGTLARYRDDVPLDSFTADSRYEIYFALLQMADISQRWHRLQDGNWLNARQGHIPAGELGMYGGDGMPWVRIYLDRLSETIVTPADAAIAARIIVRQDECFREHDVVRDRGVSGAFPAPVNQPGTSPGLSSGSPCLPVVRPVPGESAGPVPGL